MKNNTIKYRFIFMVICLAIFTVLITACRNVKPAVSSESNISGNMNNYGLAAIQGDWIYFKNDADRGNLYKVRTDDTGLTMLNTDKSAYINVSGEWVYYQNGDDNDTIYKVKTDGTDKTKLNNNKSAYIIVAGDWIYYENKFYGSNIYKVRTDGSGSQKINDDTSSFLNVVGNWIYYENGNDGSCLYKVKTDGTDKTKITDFGTFRCCVYGDWVYYLNTTDGFKIYRVKTDGSGNVKVSDEKVWTFNISGDRIFYLSFTDRAIKSMNKEGADISVVINKNNADNINMAGDWIYYLVNSSGMEVLYKTFRIKKDGTMDQLAGLVDGKTLKPSPTYRTPLASPVAYDIKNSDVLATLKPIDPFRENNCTIGDGSIKAYVVADDDYYYLIYDNNGNKTVAYRIIRTDGSKTRILYPQLNANGEKLAFTVGNSSSLFRYKYNGPIYIYDTAAKSIEATEIRAYFDCHLCPYAWDDSGSKLIIKSGAEDKIQGNKTAGTYEPGKGMTLNIFDKATESYISYGELSPDKSVLVYSTENIASNMIELKIYDFKTGSKTTFAYKQIPSGIHGAEPFYFTDNDNLMFLYESNIIIMNLKTLQRHTVIENVSSFALTWDLSKIYYARSDMKDKFIYEYDIATKNSRIAENLESPYEMIR